jgi:hypothetical protein
LSPTWQVRDAQQPPVAGEQLARSARQTAEPMHVPLWHLRPDAHCEVTLHVASTPPAHRLVRASQTSPSQQVALEQEIPDLAQACAPVRSVLATAVPVIAARAAPRMVRRVPRRTKARAR